MQYSSYVRIGRCATNPRNTGGPTVANWWELPEYEAAEKELRRASWLCVCNVIAGRFDEAREEADKANAAHDELSRIESENA